jgi:hypothetical protein
MSETRINQPAARTTPDSPAPAAGVPPPLSTRILSVLASMRITVTFLGLGVLLVFIGTLAQVDEGLYAAQNRYFRSFIVWWHPNGVNWKIPFFPGGYLIGTVLLLNLSVAAVRRFRFTWDKLGIWIVHGGLVLLLLGQFGTDFLSVESSMQMLEGETKNYSEDFRAIELVLIDKGDPKKDRVHAIPESLLLKNSELRDPALPFTLRIQKRWANAALVEPGPKAPPMAIPSGAKTGDFKDILVIPAPATAEAERRNMPAAVVEVLEGGTSHGSFIVSTMINRPDHFEANGRRYDIALRAARYYYPFSLTLLKATHEKYKGTEIPKNFASRVRVEDADKSGNRETTIYMNNPLRHGGQTFYQYQMAADEMMLRQGQRASSTLQVVRNPGWLTPYLSCTLISLGLIVQFLSHLVKFVKRRIA